MKTTKRTAVAVPIATFIFAALFLAGLSLAGCDDGSDSDQTPISSDYTIGNLTQTAGNVSAVTVTPKPDKSSGAITIYYARANIAYPRSRTVPTAAGIYAVTFDVAAASGWKEAASLVAGTLRITAANQPPATNQTPAANDYEIGNLTQTAGNVSAVTITPKQGKSTGTITIYYNGSTTLPTAAGTYTVTFSVAAASGWNAVTSLNAGTLTINGVSVLDTPITSVSIDIAAPAKDAVPATTATASGTVHYTIGTVTWSPVDNPFQGGKTYTASVTLTAASGYTFTGLTTATVNGQTATVADNTGATVRLSFAFPATDTRLVIGMSITAQPTKLTYSHDDTLDLAGLTVTLNYNDNSSDVIAVTEFAASNITTSPDNGVTLSAAANNGKPVTISYGSHTVDTGSLTVNPIAPVADDFTVSGAGTFTYNNTARTVTVTAKEGKTTGTVTVKYNGSATAPSNAGTYAVTFDVTADANYTEVTGFSAGTLVINKATPIAADFTVTGTGTFAYNSTARTVTVTVKEGKTTGTVTIKYNGSETAPSNAGTYPITIDVTADANYTDLTGFSAGTLTINKATPIANDFTVSGAGTFEYNSSARSVTATAKEGKTTGTVTVKYNGSETAPSNAGTYPITIDVTADTNYTAVSGLNVGTLAITKATPTADDFAVSGTGIFDYNGSARTVTVTAKDTVTGMGTVTVKYNGVTAAPLDGTYAVTFDVAEGANYTEASGFNAGTLAITLPPFTTIAALRSWLSAKPANTAATAYTAVLNVSSLGGNITNSGSLGYALRNNSTKYVKLDLSGSTFTSIEDMAFSECTSLTSISIPDSVTSIGRMVFSGCTSLTAITVGTANTAYSSDNGVLYNKEKTTLIQYPGGKTGAFTIPNSVTSIGSDAFRNCTNLTSVTIGNNVTSIGSYAFRNCTNLTSVTIGNGVTSIGAFAFDDCISLTAITVGTANTAYSSDNGVLYNKAKTNLIQYPARKTGSTFTIPNGVITIENSAFENCTNLTSVTIPNSVISIRNWAFSNCTSLTSVTIPNSVTIIEWGAFNGCTSLTSVTFGKAGLTFDTTISNPSFINQANSTSLQTAYTAGGIGTYTRPATTSTTWTKTSS